MNRPIKISPSLLSCDYARMGEEIAQLELLGADMLHIDVMDGHFVPNITLGAPVIKALRKVSTLCFDVHLMITDPLRYIGDFIDAGADIVTVHVECADVEESIRKIKEHGKKAALSLKPATPAKAVYPYLNDLDMVLIMTVEPGFGGQKLIGTTLPKIVQIRKLCPDLDIQVDGGIDRDTAKLCKELGANVLVAGSYIFGAADRKRAIASLRE